MAQAFTADKYTSTSVKIERYSDIGINLDVHPGKKDLTRAVDEAAVKRAVKNLILTNTGERLFAPGIGANLSRVLFELADNDSLDLAQEQVTGVLRLFEPRIRVIEVAANILPDDHTMSLTVVFSLLNSDKPTTVNLLLYRVR